MPDNRRRSSSSSSSPSLRSICVRRNQISVSPTMMTTKPPAARMFSDARNKNRSVLEHRQTLAAITAAVDEQENGPESKIAQL